MALLFLVRLDRHIAKERRLVQARVVLTHQEDDRQDHSTVEAADVSKENEDGVSFSFIDPLFV